MTITALTSTGQQSQTIKRPHPLARVIAWELRRFRASRLFWFQALGLFGFLLLMTWALHAPGNIGGENVNSGGLFSGFVGGTRAGGLFRTPPTVLVMLGVVH